MIGDEIVYWSATCTGCGQGIWGMDAPRVRGWGHLNEADADKNGRHGAFPDAATIRELTLTEYLALRGDLPLRGAERRTGSRGTDVDE